jgi:hypothetical protein
MKNNGAERVDDSASFGVKLEPPNHDQETDNGNAGKYDKILFFHDTHSVIPTKVGIQPI